MSHAPPEAQPTASRDAGAVPPEAVAALEQGLVGARVQDVRQAGEERLYLELYQPGAGAQWWLLSLDADSGRIAPTARPRGGGGPPPQFCQWLRTRLENGRVRAVRWLHPQVPLLEVVREDTAYGLVLELNRRESNLLLLDGDGRLLIAMRHPSHGGRTLRPGEAYVLPARLYAYPAEVPLALRYPAPDAETAHERERFWSERERARAFEAQRRSALQQARRELKRCRRRLERVAEDRAAAAEAEQWRRWGELLQIHRHAIEPGRDAVAVPDVFDPAQPTVCIPLDPESGAGENIERYFRRYRKRRDAAAPVAEREADTRAELEAWQAVVAALEAAQEAGDLRAPPEGLSAQAAALWRRVLRPDDGARRRGGGGADGVMTRLSADGYTVWVGRSKQENERVTFRLGNGRDWWFHAQGIAGSHVVVKAPQGEALPPRTVQEAAWLAAYYSQGRAAGKVDVDYTQRKYVRKIKGAEPGQVTYSQNRTVLVDVDDAALRAVLERVPEA